MITLLKSHKRYTVTMNAWSVEFNLVSQFLFFILLLSGDIELNPGPKYGSVLDIIHLNIRSIRNKIEDLYTIVHDFDIVCFSETHLDNNDTNEQNKYRGF